MSKIKEELKQRLFVASGSDEMYQAWLAEAGKRYCAAPITFTQALQTCLTDALAGMAPPEESSATSAFRKLGRALSDVARAITDTLASTFGKAAEAFKGLSDTMYEQACEAYLTEYGKLPGSDRTARLRRKRYRIVMEWAQAHPDKAWGLNDGMAGEGSESSETAGQVAT